LGYYAGLFAIARADLLVATIYPDSRDMYDQVTYTYNRQGQRTTMQDQNGSVHAYSYDLLGRQTADLITTLATGVDASVQQIGWTYEIHGLLQFVTSYGGSGNVVNQVQNIYNGFRQLVTQYQEHGGAVNTTSSLPVSYAYANGSANTIRPTGITYPNGRQLNYVYNSGNDDALSRISSIGDSSFSPLVAYTYLGLSSFVQADYQQPGVRWDLVGGACGAASSSSHAQSSSSSSGSAAPVSAETYAGLDQFGRVVDNLWCKYSAPSGAVDQIQYGYDQAGNRIWRKNVVAATGFDELYAYDGAQRLEDFSRGTLNAAENNIGSLTLKQGWRLDATGNWSRFQNFDQTGATPALDQQRSSDTFNEITAIAATVGPTWVTPQYDRNGNMVLMPQPAAPTASFSATYDAWNRLTALTSGSSFVGQYAYDGQNWRTRKTVSGQQRDYYYTAGWQDIEERVSTASWASSSASRSASGSYAVPQVDRQFVWGLRYIDDLVIRDRNPGGSGSSGSGSLSERLYALQDANWNVDAIVDVTGTVQERYSYSAYGMPNFLTSAFANRSSSSYQWETLYAGYRWDPAGGLLDARRRQLHSVIGAWLERDPAKSHGGRDPYSYAGGHCISRIDPYGLKAYGTFTAELNTNGTQTPEDEIWETTWTIWWTPPEKMSTDCPSGLCCDEVTLFQVAQTLSVFEGWLYATHWFDNDLKYDPLSKASTWVSWIAKDGQAPTYASGTSPIMAKIVDNAGGPPAWSIAESETQRVQSFETIAVCTSPKSGVRYMEIFGSVRAQTSVGGSPLTKRSVLKAPFNVAINATLADVQNGLSLIRGGPKEGVEPSDGAMKVLKKRGYAVWW
jgi:RHS repeat-associated protein